MSFFSGLATATKRLFVRPVSPPSRLEGVDDPGRLFPGLWRRKITLDRLEWKWGDLYNDAEVVLICSLAACGYAPVTEFGTYRGRLTYNLALNTDKQVTTIDIGHQCDAASNVDRHSYPAYKPGELFLGTDVGRRIDMLLSESP
jgi:hypothetical protein